MKGMILAAGFGTRFRPVTYEISKPMIPLCNRPLIAYAAEPLLESGVSELIVNLHHLPDALEEWLEATYGKRCRLHFSFEPEILGTGGGIRKVRDRLDKEKDFFLVNGDTIQFPSFEALQETRRATDALAALTLRHPPAGEGFTKVFVSEGRINGFGEGHGHPLMFSGSHCISSRIFDYLPERDFSGITEDVYIPLLRVAQASGLPSGGGSRKAGQTPALHGKGGESITGVVNDGLWFDIGTPSRYLLASDELRRRIIAREFPLPAGNHVSEQGSLLSESAVIEGSVRDSVIGSRTSINRGASVDACIVWDDCEVAAASLVRSVLSHAVRLRASVRAENALICRRISGHEYAENVKVAGDLVALPIDPARPFVFETGR